MEHHLDSSNLAINRQCTYNKLFAKASAPSKKSRRWTEAQDIILTGIVLDVYCQRHSLKPTRKEKTQANEDSAQSDRLVWREIKAYYDRATYRRFVLYGETYPPRSVEALQKRWKETGKENKKNYVIGPESKKRKRQPCLTKIYARIWDEDYNNGDILTCSSNEFAVMLGITRTVK